MSKQLRGQTTLWPGGAAVGANGKSTIVYLGPQENISIYVKNNDGATPTNITVELQQGAKAAGLNGANAAGDWFTLQKSDASGDLTLAVAASAKKAIALSNISASYLRLSSSGNVDILAYAEYDY